MPPQQLVITASPTMTPTPRQQDDDDIPELIDNVPSEAPATATPPGFRRGRRLPDKSGKEEESEENATSPRTKSPTGRSQRLALTKRTLLPQAETNDNNAIDTAEETRRAENAKRDQEFVDDLYANLYRNGVFSGDLSRVERTVYDLLALSEPDYLQQPISVEDIQNLTVQPDDDSYTIGNQRAQEDGTDMMTALATTGDYIGFLGAGYQGGKPGEKRERRRRLIVNVKDQRETAKVVQALLPHFDNPTIRPYLQQVKAFFATTPETPDGDVKNDKLVVYYDVGPETQDGSDVVGDTLASTIFGSLSGDDTGLQETPFYSALSPAVAWAEDPTDFMPGSSERSFTRSRADAVGLAVRYSEASRQVTGQTIKDSGQLMTQIRTAFAMVGIHPMEPHRHQDFEATHRQALDDLDAVEQ